MSGMRQFVGILWIGAFIWGIVALFQAEWTTLVIAIVAWFVLGMIFARTNSALHRAEVSNASEDSVQIGHLVHAGAWADALTVSTRSVTRLRRAVRRDNSQGMSGPLGAALLNYGVLQGANGRFDVAMTSLGEAESHLARAAKQNPHAAQISTVASEARRLLTESASLGDVDAFRDMARELNAVL